jgi:hypothetical protein
MVEELNQEHLARMRGNPLLGLHGVLFFAELPSTTE